MIPQRVMLKGFLCYKDEQEVVFDGASLWMLAGVNGSGKSSIFDAVTFALFGSHRGGSRDALGLINKDCDRLTVEFEFTLDGQSYLVRRTAQRDSKGGARNSQQLSRRANDGSSRGGWIAVEGTEKKTGFDAWIRDNIGLTYETFTSSILLLQGKSEKLLDSTAKGRFEVLAGIVDLERFEKLHKRAYEKKKRLESVAEGLEIRLSQQPEITALSILEAEERIETAALALEQAQKEIERLQELEFQARRWAELQGRLDVARRRWQESEQVLANAAQIERDVNRLIELREVLPHVQTIIEQRAQIHQSESKTAELHKIKQKLDSSHFEKTHTLDQTRNRMSDLAKRIANDEQQHRELAAQVRLLTGQLEKVKEYDRQQADRARLQADLAGLPANPEEPLRQAQEACDRILVVAQALPLLVRLHNMREELRQVQTREQTAVQSRQQVQQTGEQYSAKVDQLKPQLEEVTRAAQQAVNQATRQRTLLDQARMKLSEIDTLRGEKTCSHCGQPLTKVHLRDEKVRRQKAVAQAVADYDRAIAEEEAARRKEQELRDQFTQLEQQLHAAREEFREHRRQADQAQSDMDRLQRDCGQLYAELADPYRRQVSASPPSDWLETGFPSTDDLTSLKEQADGLTAAQQQLKVAAEVAQRWHGLKAKEATVAQSLARLQSEMKDDPQKVRKNHARLDAEEQGLYKTLEALRAECEDTQKHLDQLTKDRESLVQQLADVNGHLRTEESTRLHCQQVLGRALHEVPSVWQETAKVVSSKELFGWQGEKHSLEAGGTDKLGQELQQARAGMEALNQDLAAMEQEQDKFSPEARQDLTTLRTLLDEAKQIQRVRNEEHNQARLEKTQLDRDRQQRQQDQEKLLLAEKEKSHARKLAELLGRDHLQLHLVRQAERQVVDHANAVLDRLSGGQLYLRLCGEAGDEGGSSKALDLEAYNRTTGEKPINVAYLSGSQKFRVAVSLALGLGQYASRQHRPIESVIIDEGFGCLDKEGRQAMVRELQNLRGHLRCILLVSHQEEFAESFADGYRFELKDGATRISRFPR